MDKGKIKMSREEMYKTIKEIICTVLKGAVKEEDITETTQLGEVLNINSIVAIEILVRVENAFDIEIDDEDLSAELIANIGIITDYVERKKAEVNE